jgi:hypothetical protein
MNIDVIKSKLSDLSPKSINLYLSNLKRLNDGKEFKTVEFLKHTDKLDSILDKYNYITKRNLIITIVKISSLFPKLKSVYDKYKKMMMEMNDKIKSDYGKNEMTEKQKNNNMSWEEVKKVYESLKEEVYKFKDKETITSKDYSLLLHFIVLSLYILIPPRRNGDYINMRIVNKVHEDKKYNYLILSTDKLEYNKYKTSKSEEKKPVVDMPEELIKNIEIYIKFHPLIDKITNTLNVPLLVNMKGEPLKQDNSITLMLNKIFGKKISSTALRHIYLSSKYGKVLEEMKKDSKAMSHSLDMQKDYIKK